MVVAEFATVADARAGMKDMLDAARAGGVGLVHREGHRYALVNADEMSDVLRASLRMTPQVYFEDDAVGLALPGAPFATEGRDLDEAADDMVDALREYAGDWEELRHAPNHARLDRLVLFIEISTDAALKAWLVGDED